MKWVLVLIGWVGLKVNGLDLGSELGWVGHKVNGLDIGSGLGSNRLG